TLSGLFQRVPWASEGLGGPFRPLSMGTICLEAALHGMSARGFHLTNVALHLAVTLLAYVLALEIVRGRAGTIAPVAAAGAALVFGVHPVHTEAVDSIFNRSEVLATLWTLAGLLWLWRLADRRPTVAWVGAGVAYAGALLSKESGVSFPALAILMIVLRHAGEGWRAIVRRATPVATLLVPLGAFLLLRARTLADALGLLVWPSPLRASYDVYEPHAVAAATIALAALVTVAIVLWRDAPIVGVALAWLLTALLVSTRLVTGLSVAPFAERFLYLPSVGPALALAAGLGALGARAGRLAVVVPALALALALGLVTRQRNLDWYSDVALWEHDVAVAPANGTAWMQLTSSLLARGEHARIARLCAEHAGDPSPENGQFLNNCGLAAKALGRYEDAERLFRRAIALGEGTNVYANLGGLLARLGRPAEAETIFEQAAARETDEAMRHVRRGQMLAIVHPDRGAEARAEFQAALRVSPGFKPAVSWLERI